MNDKYEVIVGNIGTVYSGSDRRKAVKIYKNYIDESMYGLGKACGEPVSLFLNGELISGFNGTVQTQA